MAVREKQREDGDKRVAAYSDWHRTLDPKLYTTDVDFIEWRFKEGELTPVAIIEATMVDDNAEVGWKYLNAIVERYHDGIQGLAAKKVAQCMGCPAYIVLFRQDMSRFAVYSFRKQEWKFFEPADMEAFLQAL